MVAPLEKASLEIIGDRLHGRCVCCAKWTFIFFWAGYINQSLFVISRFVLSGINNFTLVNESDMTCFMGLLYRY